MNTHIPAFCAELDDTARRQILEEGYLSYGTCLTDSGLVDARIAYEQTCERHLAGADAAAGRIEYACPLEEFCTSEALVSIIANPTILAIARAALEAEEIEYTGGILRRTSFMQRDVHAIAGWHPDQFQAEGADHTHDERVAIWVYLDDVTVAEGATQMIPGSSPACRSNFLAGKDWADGLDDMLCDAAAGKNAAYAEAPAGGGMAFKSYVIHRATPNVSGLPRRIMTMDFRVRGSTNVPDGNFLQLDRDQRETMAQWLPVGILGA